MNEIDYLIFRRLDFILMDITKNVLRKLEKTKVPPALLPAIYPGRIPSLHSISIMYSSVILDETAADEPTLPITSITACLEALTQCHETIYEQEASTCVISLRIALNQSLLFIPNSSSDSDSDPEGGEIPDTAYEKAEQVQRKKLKKKRSEKMIEERIQKLNRKREVRNKHYKESSLSINDTPSHSPLQSSTKTNLSFLLLIILRLIILSLSKQQSIR